MANATATAMTSAFIANDARRQASLDLPDLIGKWFASAPQLPAPTEWQAVLDVADETKTIGLLGPALADLSMDAAPEILRRIEDARRRILVGNLRNLDWTVRILQPLRRAGIETIVFKGALRSHHVYATWDARRSSDIDLLVRPRDYDRAREALIADGMVAQVPDASVWWHHCLGESPYARADGASPLVDLHHSVQQPGGPYPADMEAFFDDSVVQSVASHTIQTLSLHHALLVCAINYGKAVRARKAWLAEIHEFAWCTRKMTEDELAALLDHAQRHRLLRLVTECLGICETLFPRSLPISPERGALALAAAGVYPEVQFERLGHLWKWIDGAGLTRIGRFGSEMFRIVRSEIALRREGLATK